MFRLLSSLSDLAEKVIKPCDALDRTASPWDQR
jgi:hypothetical protein